MTYAPLQDLELYHLILLDIHNSNAAIEDPRVNIGQFLSAFFIRPLHFIIKALNNGMQYML